MFWRHNDIRNGHMRMNHRTWQKKHLENTFYSPFCLFSWKYKNCWGFWGCVHWAEKMIISGQQITARGECCRGRGTRLAKPMINCFFFPIYLSSLYLCLYLGIFTLHHFVGFMWDIVITMWDYPTYLRFHFGLYIWRKTWKQLHRCLDATSPPPP